MKYPKAWFHYRKLNWKNKHAIIIGAGIAGSQIAWHLHQKGWKTTLIERHKQIANEASGNPAGVISPKMTAIESIGESFYTQSYRYTLSQLSILKEQGHQIKMDACGVIQLAHNPREVKRWTALKNRKLPTDFIQLLNEKDVEKVAGTRLNHEYQYKACYFPEGGWIKPSSFAKALIDHPNCKVIHETEVLHLKKQHNNWIITNNKNEIISQSEVVIIANGKDLFQFDQSNFLPGMPVAGQTTVATASDQSKKLKTVIGHEGYLTPAISFSDSHEKQHIFGATFDRDNCNPEFSHKSNEKNYQSLKQYLPDFAETLTTINNAHIAVRMTTPDRFPYVGALPDIEFYQENYHDLHQGKQWKKYPKAKYQEGLFVLGGLGSRGIITSGFCAKALCDLLENEKQSESTLQVLNNCHPARFIIKALRTRKK